MFTSTRPVSVLYLRGDELDDPDLHPVSLPGEPLELGKVESRDSVAWRSERGSITGSSLVSPSPSSLSLQSQNSTGNKPQWQDYQIGGSGSGSGSGAASSEPSLRDPHNGRPTKVRQVDEAGNLTGWIEALGVDANYRPPADRHPKPVACFYVALRRGGRPDQAGCQPRQELHRAVYLMQRTARDLVARLAAKWRFDASRVARTVHVVEPRGLEVEVDDDVVRELPEGLDMSLEIVEVPSAVPTTPAAAAVDGEAVKKEWDAMAVDDAPGEADLPSPDSSGALGHVHQHQQQLQGKTGAIELRLRY
ncbi:hypothetical protein VTH06DRAFT_5464 [Thermothelomyces fergusii]